MPQIESDRPEIQRSTVERSEIESCACSGAGFAADHLPQALTGLVARYLPGSAELPIDFEREENPFQFYILVRNSHALTRSDIPPPRWSGALKPGRKPMSTITREVRRRWASSMPGLSPGSSKNSSSTMSR